MTFNALLDAATRVDATRWTQQAWLARAAAHADAKVFQKMVTETWGHATQSESNTPDKPSGKGIADLLRDFGGGI